MSGKYYLPFLILGLFWSACANYKINYAPTVRNWEAQLPSPDEKAVYSVFLIGDAGGAEFKEVPPAIKLLKAQLKDAGKNNAVVFLGDNIYRTGLAPASEEAERSADEDKIKVQLDAVKDFPGRIFFIPGNHDWYNWKLEGIKRQANFIEDYLGRNDIWFPDPGCGGPEEVELTKDLVILLIDSQWYLQDWEDLPEINEDCDAKNRAVFEREFGEAIKSNRNKNIIVALHHPLYTFGPHGGQYRAKDHLFPLTSLNENLLIPLPIIGSLFNFLRATVGHEQDVSNPRYRQLRNSLIGSAQKNGHFVFASGHEHSLQYIERDSQVFVVSGSGSKRTAVRNGNGSGFSYAQYGWAKLDYYQDGSAWISYWVPEGDGSAGKVVFRKQICSALPDKVNTDYDRYEQANPDTLINTPVSKDNFAGGPIWSFFFGKHYRKVYGATVRVPPLDLTSFQGGVSPIRRGGGLQTNSLRLENGEGKQFTMRSIDKDASRTIPYPFNQSLAADLVQDNFSASHPFAALVIPPLADAAKVYHTNPKLYYVPRQPALKVYNDDFGDALYLVEERPDDEFWKEASFFGNPREIFSTRRALQKIQQAQDNQIDQAWVIRSRLFDMLIGDWDRHDDQWRWSLIDTGKVAYYRPIPRDRDQAFSEYDGFILSFVRHAMATSKQWRPYSGNIKPVKWGNYNARHFDPTFTTEMEWVDWEREAKFIQSQITDALIDSAFLISWPKNIYELSAPEIIKNLKARRDNLMDIAHRYYLFRAKKVDVTGTEKRELFEISRLNKEFTLIRMYGINKKLERQGLLYERTFLSSETKEINLFGLEGDDIFIIKGEAPHGPRIRLIGGPGKDFFRDESRTGGIRKNLVFDLATEDNTVEAGPGTRILISDNPSYNTYDRKAKDYEYNYGGLFPIFNFNPDDGFLLGLLGHYTTYGFHKQPFASKHSFLLNNAVATQGIRFIYKGTFSDLLFKKWDLILQARAQTPHYAINFYGMGNDTPNPEVTEGKDLDYNRVRQQLIEFKPLVMKTAATGGWGIGPTFESIRIDRTPGRFIDEIGDQFDPKIFAGVQYLGARLSFEYTNLDDSALPTRGFSLRTEGGWKFQLGNLERNFHYLDAAFSAYQRIDNQANLVFAMQIGVQHRFSNDFEFFQAASLGGTGSDANFRGLRRGRYAGKTAFYQNNELRWKILGSRNRTLPFSLGLLAGFDHGRVWIGNDQDLSETWHSSVGGGLWISPFNSFVINLSLFRADDNRNVFTFQGAYFF